MKSCHVYYFFDFLLWVNITFESQPYCCIWLYFINAYYCAESHCVYKPQFFYSSVGGLEVNEKKKGKKNERYSEENKVRMRITEGKNEGRLRKCRGVESQRKRKEVSKNKKSRDRNRLREKGKRKRRKIKDSFVIC